MRIKKIKKFSDQARGRIQLVVRGGEFDAGAWKGWKVVFVFVDFQLTTGSNFFENCILELEI
jgi:hypothetical protein